MDNRTNAWLEDILRCIDEIFEFLPEKRDFFGYQRDIKTKKAVERNIEIILTVFQDTNTQALK